MKNKFSNIALALLICSGATACRGAANAKPTLSAAVKVVPSSTLPAKVVCQQANNNLDIVKHNGRLFLAFRTAPSHFASEQATLYVMSTVDELTWDFETKITMDTDLREPRLLSWNGMLFLYFAILGKDAKKFEPQGMKYIKYNGPVNWTEPESFYPPESFNPKGFIPWRTKVINNFPYMIAYVGGESIYQNDQQSLQIHWLTTGNGITWNAVVPDQAAVQEGGGSETDFVFQDDGSLVAVIRNEAGDEMGWGSKICRAEPGSLGTWKCAADPRKYDSPLLFRHGQGIYLIGRRNLTDNGYYDLGRRNLSPEEQSIQYEFDYWVHPKRCSLWRVWPDTLTVSFVLDLPSRGDTCYAGLVQLSDRDYLLYNYSSPLDGPDVNWQTGQWGPTNIYRLILSFP